MPPLTHRSLLSMPAAALFTLACACGSPQPAAPPMTLPAPLEPPPSAPEPTPTAVPVCDYTTPGAADRDRVVLLSHRFTAEGVPGQSVTSHILSVDGDLVPTGLRSDIGVRAMDLAFAPSGEIAFAVGEYGRLVSLAVSPDGTVRVLDEVRLPDALYNRIHVSAHDNLLWLTGLATTDGGGVVAVSYGCSGALTVDRDDFLPMQMTYAMGVLPGEELAVIGGGQPGTADTSVPEVFLAERSGMGWRIIDSLNLFNDRIDIPSIGVATDGSVALIPNASIYSDEAGDVVAVAIVDRHLEQLRRQSNINAPSTVLFVTDYTLGLVTQPQNGRITVIGETSRGIRRVDSHSNLGIVDRMAIVRRGSLRDVVLVPRSTHGGDHLIDLYRVESDGDLTIMSSTDIGAALDNIVQSIAVAP